MFLIKFFQFKTDARLTLQNSFLYLPEVGERKFDTSKFGQKQLLLSSISSKNKRFLNAFYFLKLIF